MVDYNIEVVVYPELGYMVVDSFSGQYEYQLGTADSDNILSKILGSQVKSTVYAQDEEMSIEEYESRFGEMQ